MKRTIAMLLALTMFFTVSACTKRLDGEEDEPEESAEVTESPSPTPEEPEESEEPEVLYRSQFNGEPLEEPDYTRPFAVMINNHKNAQPHRGTSEADIIFEILAEGEVTRMMAIYSNIQTESEIGPVRSIRTYYIGIGLSFGAVTVHAGGSDGAYNMIRSYGINNIDGVNDGATASYFHRDSSRSYLGYEHTLFTTGDDLYTYATEKKGYETEVSEDYSTGLIFSPEVEIEGDDALTIKAVFNSGKSTSANYHEDKGVYTLYQFGNDYYDQNTGENVEFENVIVISAVTSTIDGYGRLDVQLVGEGEGYFFHNGKAVPISWSREDDYSPIIYTYEDGSQIELGVGKTYIAVIPTYGSVTYE